MTYTVYEAMPLSQMLARVQKYYPGDGYKLVEKAYLFAQEAHKNQYRKSGEPYFTHPCFVASILVELSLDPPTIAAGLLQTRWRTARASRWIPFGRNSARKSPCWWMA